jgi:hypothetical protein
MCHSVVLVGTDVSEEHIASIFRSKNSVALSLQANYTDWGTATCRRNLVSTFVDLYPQKVAINFVDKWRGRVVRAADLLRSLISVF